MDQWSLYIDIEGFGATYERDAQAIISLGTLMEGIHSLGSRCYPETPHRMFAHQLGDGFVIVGEFGWRSLEQPLTVAVALLRAVLASHGMAKAAISEGRFADVVGCYPLRIQELYAKSYGGAIPMGRGVMTILPVMGTALINSYQLLHSEATPSGALLLVQAAAADRVPPGTLSEIHQRFLIIDWIHTLYPGLEQTIHDAGLPSPPPQVMLNSLRRHMVTNDTGLSDSWRSNTKKFLHADEY